MRTAIVVPTAEVRDLALRLESVLAYRLQQHGRAARAIAENQDT